MQTKSMCGQKGSANYRVDVDGKVCLETVVTSGNFVERYNGKVFHSETELLRWLDT